MHFELSLSLPLVAVANSIVLFTSSVNTFEQLYQWFQNKNASKVWLVYIYIKLFYYVNWIAQCHSADVSKNWNLVFKYYYNYFAWFEFPQLEQHIHKIRLHLPKEIFYNWPPSTYSLNIVTDLPTFLLLPEQYPPEILNKSTLLSESQIKLAKKV